MYLLDDSDESDDDKVELLARYGNRIVRVTLSGWSCVWDTHDFEQMKSQIEATVFSEDEKMKWLELVRQKILDGSH